MLYKMLDRLTRPLACTQHVRVSFYKTVLCNKYRGCLQASVPLTSVFVFRQRTVSKIIVVDTLLVVMWRKLFRTGLIGKKQLGWNMRISDLNKQKN